MIIKCTLLLLLAVLGGHADDNSTCGDYPAGHTMCLPPAPAGSCDGVLCGVTRKEARKIERSHNALRNRVASGKEKRGTPPQQPAATNMAVLKWDEELAAIAQRWADQLKWEHDCSSCRQTSSGEYAGQNMALVSSSQPITEYNWRKEAIRSWYSEVEKMNGTRIGKDGFTFDSETGHYTQVVWAATTKLGCGIRSSNTTCAELGYSGWYCAIAVCNYLSGGNIGGSTLYSTTGDLCEKRHKIFKFLCKGTN